MKRFTFFIFFFVLFFVSCSINDAPFEHRYVINLVLKPDMKFQRAFVDSTYRLDQVLGSSTGIPGARIFIVDENSDTFRYGEFYTSPVGFYQSYDSFCVKHGMKYLVNISVEGEVISREVQVPGSLAIFSPGHLDTVSLSNPPLLIWNSCEDVYENTYMAAAYIAADDDREFIPMLTPDTTLGIFYNRFLFEEKDTMYTVLVEAMDSNMYTYLLSFAEYGELKEGTAIGLIGAISFDTVAVWVKE